MIFAREVVIEAKLFSVVRGGLIRITESGKRVKQKLPLGLGTVQWLGRVLDDDATSKSKDFYS